MKSDDQILAEYDAQQEAKLQIALQAACSERKNWRITRLQGGMAEIHAETYPGRIWVCTVIYRNGSVSFYVPTRFIFNALHEVPHHLSTELLLRNDSRFIGFWCLEELTDKYAYSCIHMTDVRALDVDEFRKIITVLISECDAFEDSVSA